LLVMDYLERWEELLPLMGNFVIVEARARYDLQGIEYLAYSPLFEPVPHGVEAPEYNVVVTISDFSPAVIRCERIPQSPQS
jgi:hypothetical protein